jgi:hypothetical protein
MLICRYHDIFPFDSDLRLTILGLAPSSNVSCVSQESFGSFSSCVGATVRSCSRTQVSYMLSFQQEEDLGKHQHGCSTTTNKAANTVDLARNIAKYRCCCQSSGAVTQHDIGISIKVTCHSCRLHDSLALLAADALHILVLPLLQLCIRFPCISTLLSANIDTCNKTTLTSRSHLQQHSQNPQYASLPRLGCLALRHRRQCL